MHTNRPLFLRRFRGRSKAGGGGGGSTPTTWNSADKAAAMNLDGTFLDTTVAGGNFKVWARSIGSETKSSGAKRRFEFQAIDNTAAFSIGAFVGLVDASWTGGENDYDHMVMWDTAAGWVYGTGVGGANPFALVAPTLNAVPEWGFCEIDLTANQVYFGDSGARSIAVNIPSTMGSTLKAGILLPTNPDHFLGNFGTTWNIAETSGYGSPFGAT